MNRGVITTKRRTWIDFVTTTFEPVRRLWKHGGQERAKDCPDSTPFTGRMLWLSLVKKRKEKKYPAEIQSRRNIFAAKEIILPPIKSDLIVHLFSLVGLRIENREHRWFSQFYRCFVVDITNISSIDNIFHVSCKYVAIKSSILELLMQDSWESWGYFFFRIIFLF